MRNTTNLGLFVPEDNDFFFEVSGPEQKNPDILDAAYQDHEARVATLEGKTDSFYADIEAYYGNTKLIDDFQDVSGYITGSADTTNIKIGNQSLRISESDNTGGIVVAEKENINLDLSKLNDGSESGEGDYVIAVVYISDITKVVINETNTLTIRFSQDTPFTTTNMKQFKNITGLQTGWNFLKLKKSQATTFGTGSWSGIKSMVVGWQSTDNAQGAYVSFQLIQLVKKDPLEDYPNPFQRNGVSDLLEEPTGEWFVGYEFGEVILKEFSDISESFLVWNKSFKNFSKLTYIATASNDNSMLPVLWRVDANNSFGAYVRIDYLRIVVVENGVTNNYDAQALDIKEGDKILVTISKAGSKFNVIATNLTIGVSASSYYESSILEPLSGNIAIQTISDTYGSVFYSISITEIKHAHHADIAEMAKGLIEQAKCRVYSSLNQSILNNTATYLNFDSVTFDNRSHFDINLPQELTIRETGLYSIVPCARFESNSAGYRQIIIRKNGSAISTQLLGANPSGVTILQGNSIYEFNANDKIAIAVVQNSGISIDVQATDTWLSIAKIG